MRVVCLLLGVLGVGGSRIYLDEPESVISINMKAKLAVMHLATSDMISELQKLSEDELDKLMIKVVQENLATDPLMFTRLLTEGIVSATLEMENGYLLSLYFKHLASSSFSYDRFNANSIVTGIAEVTVAIVRDEPVGYTLPIAIPVPEEFRNTITSYLTNPIQSPVEALRAWIYGVTGGDVPDRLLAAGLLGKATLTVVSEDLEKCLGINMLVTDPDLLGFGGQIPMSGFYAASLAAAPIDRVGLDLSRVAVQCAVKQEGFGLFGLSLAEKRRLGQVLVDKLVAIALIGSLEEEQ